MRWHKDKPMILYAAAALVIFILVSAKLIPPIPLKWKNQTQLIQQKELTLKRSLAIIQNKELLANDFSDLSKKIQARLPAQRGESTFLAAIGDVAQKTNVHIETMNPLPYRDLGFLKELSVEINMEANLGNLALFLYQMRQSSVALAANRLKLEPKSERSALLKGYLVISTIFLKEQ